MTLIRASQLVSKDHPRNLDLRLIGVLVAAALAIGVGLTSWRQTATTYRRAKKK